MDEDVGENKFSVKRLLIITTYLDGFGLGELLMIPQIYQIFPHQTFPLYSITFIYQVVPSTTFNRLNHLSNIDTDNA